ncbi:hypothetical protein LptCag_0211 [Leptospirillum ferriphilum]|uniref:Uncharacterized protein n=1 Tax=Leptospirillum ferriphilum TaxID=178606 RepID=A0A094W7Y5_9BACT|nr:hypothetical protein LptCag_0211 [Leptospirillum ferriphilum]
MLLSSLSAEKPVHFFKYQATNLSGRSRFLTGNTILPRGR